MLLATKILIQNKLSAFSIVCVTLVSLALMSLYAFFENGTHTFLGSNAQNISVSLTPYLFLVAILFALFAWLPLLGASGFISWPTTLKDRLYVWLLNQSGKLSTKTLLTQRLLKS
jgi:hypothetical protein